MVQLKFEADAYGVGTFHYWHQCLLGRCGSKSCVWKNFLDPLQKTKLFCLMKKKMMSIFVRHDFIPQIPHLEQFMASNSEETHKEYRCTLRAQNLIFAFSSIREVISLTTSELSKKNINWWVSAVQRQYGSSCWIDCWVRIPWFQHYSGWFFLF